MSIWTTLPTWEVGTPITAYRLNQIQENINYLKARPSDSMYTSVVSGVSITSTSFITIDSTILKRTVRTYGGDVLYNAHLPFIKHSTASGPMMFDVLIDGTEYLSSRSGTAYLYGIAYFLHTSAGDADPFNQTFLISGLDPGEHTFELVARTTSGTITIALNAGTWTGGSWAVEVN